MSTRRSIKSMSALQISRELVALDDATTSASLLEKQQKLLLELDRRRAGGTRRRGPGYVAPVLQKVPTVEILKRGGPRRDRSEPGICPVRTWPAGGRCGRAADPIDGDRMRCASGHVYRGTVSESPINPTTSPSQIEG